MKEADNEHINNPQDDSVGETKERTTSDFFRPCPICGEAISMNERVCPHCGYYESKEGGYKPMTKIETRRIKTVLFFVLMAAAIVVYLLLR